MAAAAIINAIVALSLRVRFVRRDSQSIILRQSHSVADKHKAHEHLVVLVVCGVRVPVGVLRVIRKVNSLAVETGLRKTYV